MSTGLISRTVSMSSEQTEQLAESLGKRLRGGEVIELVSDLGGGKTTFVRGLARGIGSKDKVSSPSFTLSNQYQASSLILHHFDFYRLNEPGIMKDELAEVIADPEAVTVVEWADIVEDVLSHDKLTVNIKTTGEETRELTPSRYPNMVASHTLLNRNIDRVTQKSVYFK
jgi:tRNA threonylcarbamoyladenosine biosynthesis protein TsaE